MNTAKTFKDLIVWQKAHSFVLSIYKMTSNLPKDEIYGLTSQIRRASVSIPANIAEGFTRKSNLEKIRFYNISQGSLEEVRYYLILIGDLNYFQTNDLNIQLEEVSKLLNAYKRTLNSES
ncbi:MAG: four helix bundle protein [Tenuifilaceae bacterium]